jgi:hypothetical protein
MSFYYGQVSDLQADFLVRGISKYFGFLVKGKVVHVEGRIHLIERQRPHNYRDSFRSRDNDKQYC